MSSSESLSVYWGGLLYNGSSPLEISLNRCSHGCVYCFANLNQPDRQTKLKQIQNLLADYQNRETYVAHLLREKYAVTISNHVDPFSASNWFQFLPLLETLTALDIPVTILTRFGRAEWVGQALDILDGRPTAFYVSIPTFDDEIARKCEPGAPLPGDRLDFIDQVIARGHKVTVGINPIIPNWIEDPQDFMQRLHQAGVWGVWLNKIHLSKRQVDNMPERDKVALGEENLAIALAPNKHGQLTDAFNDLKAAALAAGLEVYTGQQSDRSDYFKWEQALVPKSFPLMQDFVNLCHDTKQAGDSIHWGEFRDYFVPRLPAGVWGLRDHLNAAVMPVVLYGKFIPQRMNYEELLWHCWRHKETLFCPANVDCFAWAGDRVRGTKNTWNRHEDSDGNPVLIFAPGGTNNCAYTKV